VSSEINKCFERNTDLLVGQDAEVLKVADDLWLLYYGPDGYFDQARCDIRLAVFRGQFRDPAGILQNKVGGN
jgi:hypothetical protein